MFELIFWIRWRSNKTKKLTVTTIFKNRGSKPEKDPCPHQKINGTTLMEWRWSSPHGSHASNFHEHTCYLHTRQYVKRSLRITARVLYLDTAGCRLWPNKSGYDHISFSDKRFGKQLPRIGYRPTTSVWRGGSTNLTKLNLTTIRTSPFYPPTMVVDG
jgi:hypothetical protein